MSRDLSRRRAPALVVAALVLLVLAWSGPELRAAGQSHGGDDRSAAASTTTVASRPVVAPTRAPHHIGSRGFLVRPTMHAAAHAGSRWQLGSPRSQAPDARQIDSNRDRAPPR